MLVLLGLLALASSTEIGIDPVNMGQMNQVSSHLVGSQKSLNDCMSHAMVNTSKVMEFTAIFFS